MTTLDKYALEAAIIAASRNWYDYDNNGYERPYFNKEWVEYTESIITAYLSAVKPQSAWLPIESAPINTFVLACSNSTSRIVLKDGLGNWRYRHGGPISNKPTHYQPLPAPPQSDSKED